MIGSSQKKKFAVVTFLVLALLISSSLLVFAKTKTLNILGIAGWAPSERAKPISKEFSEYAKEKLGYEVNVKWTSVPWGNLYSKMSTTLASGSSGVDIMFSDSQYLGAFASPGHLVKLNNYFDEYPELKEVVEKQVPLARDAYMSYPYGSDNYYGVGVEGDTHALYVRTDLLRDPKERKEFKEEYGWELPQTYEDFLPLTWSDYKQVLDFFTRPEEDLWGMASMYGKGYDYIFFETLSFIWMNGGDVIDWDTNQVDGILNSEKTIEGIKKYFELGKYQPPGYKNYGINSVLTPYQEGKVLSFMGWVASAPGILDSKVSTEKVVNNTMIVPPPAMKTTKEEVEWQFTPRNEEILEGDKLRFVSIGGQPWVISSYSNNKKEAINFLIWWYKDEVQKKFAEAGGNPTTKFIHTEEFKEINPWNRAYSEMFTGHTRDWVHIPNYKTLLKANQQELHKALMGEQTVREAVNNMVERQEKSMKRWGLLKEEK